MMENGRGLIKALENWAKKVTSGYKDVEVRDLSTSFRDGLAFCAIVHHYRPDLINFDSLSKENIYENNSLAFGVAEKQLGVPALLDAEDMVKYPKPDRLSIITYLSQLRNCFENQNKVSKKPDLKRIQSNSSGPPAKVPVVSVSSKRHEVCQVCQHRVFILERLIVDNKLYHTTCFRCHKCDALLNPGAYVEGDSLGLYECTVCVQDEAPESSDLSMEDVLEKDIPSEAPFPRIVHPADVKSNESIMFARSNLGREEEKSDSDFNLPDSPSIELKSRSGSSVSVKDKINAFENRPKSPILSRPIPRPRQSLLISPHSEATVSPTIVSPSGSAVSEDEKKDIMKKEETDSPIRKSELSSPLRENLFPARSGSLSPRVPRDIFKSSLSPLKLTLPSSVRKDPEKSSPIHSLTLPYSRSISLLKQPDKVFNFDTKLQSDSKVTRRSSLESSYEPSKEDKNSTEVISISRTYSSQEIGGDSEVVHARFATYTPVYKSLLNTSIQTSESSAPKLTIPPLHIHHESSFKLENAEKKSYKSTKTLELESDSNADSKILENVEKGPNLSTEIFTPLIDSLVDPKKSAKIQDDFTESEKDVTITSPPVLSDSAKKSDSDALSKDEEYPDNLNPFGDDDAREEEYPDDLNPFGDDEEEIVHTSMVHNTSMIPNTSIVDDYDESKNPFASDDDEDSFKVSESKTPQDSLCSNVSSPSGSLKGTLKKRRAPKPPLPRAMDIFPPSKDSALDSGVDSSFSSPSLSRKNFKTSSPKVRKNKPAPPPPPQDPAASIKKGKESENMKLRMQQVPKKKKRPAPSVPISLRRDMKKIPLKEIVREMKEIEEKQREYERQGREIELLIRDRDKDEEPSVEEEEYIMQLFELVNQKNALFRRQAELMYIKRSQRLEELQHQIEKEIRQLMEKPESEKTEEDRQKEEELTMELIDIVDQRNSIIDSIEMDRRRELEEDHSVQEQLEIKNGDLPIPAEIKQKSGKAKKKAKKEKKKEEESGKGTLKKKKNLFSKRS